MSTETTTRMVRCVDVVGRIIYDETVNGHVFSINIGPCPMTDREVYCHCYEYKSFNSCRRAAIRIVKKKYPNAHIHHAK